MSAYLSSTKAAALLARVQLNPHIGSVDSSYVTDLVQRAANDLVTTCRLNRYPEASVGYAASGLGASTNITALASNQIVVSVNGQSSTVSIPLAGLDTGAEIATALQTAINAVSYDGFEEVTVTFSGSGATAQYTLTGAQIGEQSVIECGFHDSTKHLARALKLSKWYGATEVSGSFARTEADDAIVEMVEVLYRKLGLEGVQAGSVPGDNSFTMFADELTPRTLRTIENMRRLWHS